MLCGSRNASLLCPACQGDLPWQGHACRCCACALPAGLELCGRCLRDPPAFTQTHALFTYQYPLDILIKAAKFRADLNILHTLGQLMAAQLATTPPKPDSLIPVPMHPSALRVRGYNQAVQLARPITARHGIPLVLDACRCVKKKRRQASLSSYRERLLNVKGAFAVTRIAPEWQRIVLVDDVMTTGATVGEISRLFIAAGVPRVDVWCCARRNVGG